MEILFEFLFEFCFEMILEFFGLAQKRIKRRNIEYLDSQILEPAGVYVFNEVREYLFSCCNKVQFLAHDIRGLELDGNDAIMPIAIFKNSFISNHFGESFGNEGYIYTFSLTEELKSLLKSQKGINSVFFCKEERLSFENIAFIKDDIHIVDCLSHEGVTKINPDFKKDFKEVFIKAVKSDPVFLMVKEHCRKLRLKERNLWHKKAKTALFDLRAYIAQTEDTFIKPCPHITMEYDEFIGYVNIFMSERIKFEFANTNNFKDLKTNPFIDQYHLELYYLSLLIETRF